MPRTYEFVQLDVFTQTPLQGNPLAVFTDARGLSDAEMQALAREMNLSETTFILPRDNETEARDGKRVRIFTVNEELPFAGHPTLGTALYLHANSRSSCDEVVLDLKVGRIPVRIERRADGSVFGEMRQRDPEFGPTIPRDVVARAIGTDVDTISTEWPIQVVSTGLPFAIVPLRDRKVLAELKPVSGANEALHGTNAQFFYFLACDSSREMVEVRARMFSYGGEDPATGSAAGCAAAWMAKYGIAASDQPVLIRQGVEMNRPSEIYIRAARDGEKITNVRVGGHAVEVLRGTVTL